MGGDRENAGANKKDKKIFTTILKDKIQIDMDKTERRKEEIQIGQ